MKSKKQRGLNNLIKRQIFALKHLPQSKKKKKQKKAKIKPYPEKILKLETTQ